MRRNILYFIVLGIFTATSASAACEGGLGRGWSKGKGKGAFELSAGSKACDIGFANFYDNNDVATPATEVALTKAPKSGKISIGKSGVVYTPNAGFKGKDTFCTKNTAAKVKGALTGCITVTVK